MSMGACYAEGMRLWRWICWAAALLPWGCGAVFLPWAAQAASAADGFSYDVGNRGAEVPLKVRRYAERLLQRYDTNHDGLLEPNEWSKMQGQPEAADADRNGKITLEEWTNHIVGFGRGRRMSQAATDVNAESAAPPVPPAKQGETGSAAASVFVQPPRGSPSPATFHIPKSRLPAGLPDWFLQRDRNGDGQVSLAEYAPSATPTEVEQFKRYDRNGDGLITVQEALGDRDPSRRRGSGSGQKGEKRSDGK